MSIIKKYHDKKWTLQFLDALYNSIDKLNNHNTSCGGPAGVYYEKTFPRRRVSEQYSFYKDIYENIHKR
jgi:hypothetical protein